MQRDMGPPRRRRESSQYRPATLGSSLRAHVIVIATCRDCRHQAEPDLADQVDHYGADLPLPEWGARLICSACGSRQAEFVVSGYRPPDRT